MAVEITMPQLSDTMSEGRILVWRKKEGDAVKRGEALAEVATDKADLEIESFHQGTLLKVFATEGSTVKVGSVIAVIGEAGESVADSAPKGASAPAAAAPVAQATKATPAPALTATVTSAPAASSSTSYGVNGTERIKISPLARNVAQAHGVDYAGLKGTGEGGRIVRRDIEGAVGQAVSAPAPVAPVQETRTGAKLVPLPQHASQQGAQFETSRSVGSEDLSRMRQTIASRMVESKTTIPHFYMTAKIQVDALSHMRATLKALPQYEGLTVNHLVIKATALALRANPRLNSSFHDGKLLTPPTVNVGIVTALPDGLLIPVLKNADQMHLADIAADGRALIQRARAGRPKADDLLGATFSISNVGPSPVESFSAIISPGQGGILAVSAIQDEPVVVNGEIRPGQVMRVTLSVDHRIIDGVVAGEFLKELKRLLEEPILLLA